MKSIRSHVNAVHTRRQKQWIWHCVSWGLVAGGMIGCLSGVLRMASGGSLPISWIVTSLVIGPTVGLVWSFIRPCRLHEAAVQIDRKCGLKDRIATALSFMDKNSDSPLHQLQIDDAAAKVAAVEPAKVAPIKTPRSLLPGLGLYGLAAILAFFSTPPQTAVAAPSSNPVVSEQAHRIENSLDELEDFDSEDMDKEVKDLLKELKEKIDELKEPGIDPKEALAKLSEMEAALQEQQELLEQQDTEAALQEVGQAISLAEPFEAAGQAMAAGDMQKAAEELKKLEMPELDRKTEKAIKEKMDKVAAKNDNGAQKQLKNAIAQFSEGMSKGNRSKFKDGVEGLAGQCKKQGNRKRLADLLRKQCQCLGECKSECEGACKSSGSGKGGDSWGLGKSGNQPGEKTSLLKSGQQMQITGQESDSGDVDVETLESNPQQQEAVRQYTKNAEKYEQMTESVLSSEPIPLGHRQTIRRYFEMIRPQGNETDKVLEKSNEEK